MPGISAPVFCRRPIVFFLVKDDPTDIRPPRGITSVSSPGLQPRTRRLTSAAIQRACVHETHVGAVCILGLGRYLHGRQHAFCRKRGGPVGYSSVPGGSGGITPYVPGQRWDRTSQAQHPGSSSRQNRAFLQGWQDPRCPVAIRGLPLQSPRRSWRRQRTRARRATAGA